MTEINIKKSILQTVILKEKKNNECGSKQSISNSITSKTDVNSSSVSLSLNDISADSIPKNDYLVY